MGMRHVLIPRTLQRPAAASGSPGNPTPLLPMCYSALQSVCTVWASEGNPRRFARCPNRNGADHDSSNSPVGLPWCRVCDCVRSRGASRCAGQACGAIVCAERRELCSWLPHLRRQPGPALPSGRHRREQRLQRPRLRFHNDRGDDRCCCMVCGGWARTCRTIRMHIARRRHSEGRRCQTPIT